MKSPSGGGESSPIAVPSCTNATSTCTTEVNVDTNSVSSVDLTSKPVESMTKLNENGSVMNMERNDETTRNESGNADIEETSCEGRTDDLDEALDAVDSLDVRVKDEPLENVGDILMDDELRLQLEQSIDIVVNELSTPDDDATFQEDAESGNETSLTNTTTISSLSTVDPVLDSMNDLEHTLDPDLQAVCDVLRMANSSPLLRRPDRTRDGETVSTKSDTPAKNTENVNVKREPRDNAIANILSVVESLPTSSSSTASISSPKEIRDESREQCSNPIDLLTLLSLDKKPAALSISPVKFDKSSTERPSTKVTNGIDFGLKPNVTIKSVPSNADSTPSSTKCLPLNEDRSKLSEKIPNIPVLPVESKLSRDGSKFASSPDSFSSLPYSVSNGGNAKMTHSSSMSSLACCSPLSSRPVDAFNGYMFFNKTSNPARPASCSYSNYNCRRMSPYPPQYQHLYTGMRSPGARVPTPYNAPPARTLLSNPSSCGINPVMNGTCCTPAASSISPSLIMNSRPNNYPALPSLLPPSPLNQCRKPLSPTSPSFPRSREYPNMFPDSTGGIAGSTPEAMACMQQQQSFRPSSTWGAPLNPYHSPTSRPSFSLSSPKGGRGSSVVQHSSSPNKNQLFRQGSTSFGYPMSAKNGSVGTGNATNMYGNSLNDDFPSSSMPFQREQCCFSSQIQCFNAACDNTAQQQVSIIQHSTRLSNLKSNTMDSISSLLQYHSYFKKY